VLVKKPTVLRYLYTNGSELWSGARFRMLNGLGRLRFMSSSTACTRTFPVAQYCCGR